MNPRRAGHYEIAALLGRGGMGVVYRATDTRTGATVALKSLPHADPAAVMRFKQEFRALADISHPHLASLHELFLVEDTWWLAMEYVEGTDFLAYVRGARGPEPADFHGDDETREEVITGPPHGGIVNDVRTAVPIGADQLTRLRGALAELAAALYELHTNDTLHRDVKPSNVMVDANGRVVLLDFGLAMPLSATRSADDRLRVTGTVPYMAPEQATGGDLGPAADWYAVGVMLYEALVGRLPFAGRITDVLHQKQTLVPVSPIALNPALPQDLVQLCEALLSIDPARRPGGRAVLSALGVREPGARSRGDEMLLGRGGESAILREALARVRRGVPATVFVEGPSGAGKSHLVRHFLEEARALPEAVVLSGRCYEDESVPYKALDSLIDALAGFLTELSPSERAVLAPADPSALGRVFPVLRDLIGYVPERGSEVPDQQELRRRAFRGLRDLLTRVGARRTLVLHIDDLQWGDADSAVLLGDVLRAPDAPVLLLLGVYRSEYAGKSACLQTLRAEYPRLAGAPQTITVGPLDDGDARVLARALLPRGTADADRLAATIVRESRGIPFFIHELARHAAAGADLTVGATNLDEVVRRRAAELPPAAREVLEVVAVCGHPITRQALAAATGHSDRGLLRQLRTAHFIRTTGADDADWVEPYHDRIREAVAGALEADASRSHHQRLAVTLERLGAADPETLAVHFESGGVRERAGFYFGQAASLAAEILAFDRAASLYDRALQLHTGTGDEARHLRRQLADALANSGRGPDAAREYLAASEGAASSEALDLQRKAAYQYCVSGHLREGRAALGRLLDGVGHSMPGRRGSVIARLLLQRGRLRLRGLRFTPREAAAIDPRALLESDLTWAASAGLSMFDVLAGAEFQSRNLYHALRIGEPSRVARALAWEAAHTSNAGSAAWRRTARLLEAATTLASRLDDPHAAAMVRMSEGIAEFTMGRWETARDRLVESSETFRSRCRGVAWEMDTAHTFELWARIYMGDLSAMTARTAHLLKEATDRGDRYAVTNLGSFMVPHGHLMSDAPGDASRTVDGALELWGLDGYHLQHMTALMMRVYIDLYRGDGAAALERLRARRGWVRSGFFTTIQVLRIVLASLEGRAALMAAASPGRRGEFGPVALRAARRMEREGIAWGRPLARLLRAGAAAIDGRNDDAARLLERAATEFDAVPMHGYAAAARWRAATLAGDRARGRELTAAATRWFERESVRNPERFTTMLAFGAN